MAIVAAVLLALFVVPRPWSWIVVALAVVYEVGTDWLGWHWSRTRRVVVGPEALVGLGATVLEDCRPDGWVRVQGERWRAHCAAGAGRGEAVRVVGVEELTLVVEPAG